MNKTELKALIKEAFLTEKKNTLLNENAPGFDNRKQGEALPTLESVKAAYQAKKLEEVGELKEALNKDLKSFGMDLKKFMEGKGLEVKLQQGSSQPLYDPIGKNPNFAALNLQDDDLHVIVNDNKIDVLKDIIKRYNLKPLQSLKQTGGWADDPKKKAQSKGEIYISSDKPLRRGEAFTLELRRFDPSTIMETNETVEEITTVTKMTKPAEAAEIAKAEGTPKTTVDAAIKKAKTSGKDVSIAEDTLEEDRFVDSSLEDLRQVVRNLAHTAGMGIEEAAEMAMMHIEDMFMGGEEIEEGVEKDYWADYTDIGMFYIGIDAKHSLSDHQLEKLGEKIVKQLYGGDVGKAYDDIVRGKKRGSHTDIKEAKMEKEFNYIYAREREHKERMRIANELFPEIAKEQEGGKLVNFIPLSDEQRDEVYREYAKKPVDENLDKVNLANVTATKANAAIINAPTMGAVLLKVYKQLQDKEQTDFSTNQDLKVVLAKLEKLASQVQRAGKSSSDAGLKESIIAEADMIIESFRTKK